MASPTMVSADTQLTQVPVIMRGGEIVIDQPDLYDKPDKDLQQIAKAFNGKVAYRWKRVVYTELIEQLCTHYGCPRPVKSGDGRYNCGDHQ